MAKAKPGKGKGGRMQSGSAGAMMAQGANHKKPSAKKMAARMPKGNKK